MKDRESRVCWALVLGVLASLALCACGSKSSSADASKLLQETFAGAPRVASGDLSFNLSITPSGAAARSGPVALGLSGPFQSLGAGRLPKSNFTVSVSALGRRASLGVLSTGTSGLITFMGTGYQLPPATFQKLESSFAQIASPPSDSPGSATLSSLRIHPLGWLIKPRIVGHETVAGAATTHIRAGVNAAALLTDLSPFIQMAASLSESGTSGGVPATTSPIAAQVKNPSFDVWTGRDDRIVRRVAIALTLVVSGPHASRPGSPRSEAIGLTTQYANVNRPQTITAPTTIRPFSEFAANVRALSQGLQAGLGGLSGN